MPKLSYIICVIRQLPQKALHYGYCPITILCKIATHPPPRPPLKPTKKHPTARSAIPNMFYCFHTEKHQNPTLTSFNSEILKHLEVTNHTVHPHSFHEQPLYITFPQLISLFLPPHKKAYLINTQSNIPFHSFQDFSCLKDPFIHYIAFIVCTLISPTINT